MNSLRTLSPDILMMMSDLLQVLWWATGTPSIHSSTRKL